MRGVGPAPQIKEWVDRMMPVIVEARSTLRAVKPGKLALRTGCERDAQGNYRLTFFSKEYVISADDFVVRDAATGKAASSFTASLLLTYMATADGTTPSGRWVGFHELPDGMFYVQAFQGYTGVRLVRELESACAMVTEVDPLMAFHRAAERLGGRAFEIGEAGYVFGLLPRVSLALVYWLGDDEFPSQARVLFEDSACHYLPTDGLAILGSQLVGRVLNAASQATV